jgi:hypothetical protein
VPTTRWYGWQTLVADGTAILALTQSKTTPLVAFGIADYLLGAPIIHWAHGRGAAGAGSLAMRVGPWLLFGIVDSASDCSFLNGSNSCDALVGTAVLAVLSIPAAIAIDASVLAREQIDPPRAVTWRPVIDVHRDRASLGVGGSF